MDSAVLASTRERNMHAAQFRIYFNDNEITDVPAASEQEARDIGAKMAGYKNEREMNEERAELGLPRQFLIADLTGLKSYHVTSGGKHRSLVLAESGEAACADAAYQSGFDSIDEYRAAGRPELQAVETDRKAISVVRGSNAVEPDAEYAAGDERFD